MTDPFSHTIAELLKQGILGILLIGVSAIAWRLFGRVEDLQNKRVDDAHRSTAVLTENAKVIEADIESRDAHTRAIERFNQTSQELVSIVRNKQ